ncbi:CRISPR-associated protein, Csh2 family [Methanococcus aeolicus Nankai-3]|uniref:CRISPR-associated protein, Csh2 family n=1 Tax=Methanococcus aeolicus (strain ATCC BAA-1280 / DSM 17508 / OCM 812 / Nankai-3) TaxID=419665 RepID=A6UVX7_META3|nr:type I-B CRISPR-associated protein Cas7/Csh2 [Methanococcus aeolicus]ABR56649.1 CRISPR-associated protein, Csh2 family [Methanococcus aeolicus Nankai-3]
MSNTESNAINRSELIFLYDAQYINPNGDPLDDNKPRIDPSTGINLVSDVRLKRTIRDYLNNFNGEEIFVREIEDDKGNIQDAKLRAEDFLHGEDNNKIDKSKLTLNDMKEIMQNNILNNCIDVRLFGGTIPIELNKNKGGSITLTGPVQFRFGKSLHKVELMFVKGTGAFASGKDKGQKTFREEYVVPYSLISFYGIINENAAKHTNLSNEDINKLIDAIWNGTKNLISRSKIGQTPKLLIKVNYKENNYHIGDLDKCLILKSDVNDEEIRSSDDYKIDMTKLIDILLKNKDKIENVEYVWDDRLKLTYNDEEFKFNVDGNEIEFKEINI